LPESRSHNRRSVWQGKKLSRTSQSGAMIKSAIANVLTHQGEAQYFITKAEAKALGQWLTKRAEICVRKPVANKPKGPSNG
jgi:hypothetical protein